jgi:hypothetical protein
VSYVAGEIAREFNVSPVVVEIRIKKEGIRLKL